jgi:hypothetical protein
MEQPHPPSRLSQGGYGYFLPAGSPDIIEQKHLANSYILPSCATIPFSSAQYQQEMNHQGEYYGDRAFPGGPENYLKQNGHFPTAPTRCTCTNLSFVEY